MILTQSIDNACENTLGTQESSSPVEGVFIHCGKVFRPDIRCQVSDISFGHVMIMNIKLNSKFFSSELLFFVYCEICSLSRVYLYTVGTQVIKVNCEPVSDIFIPLL